jgi:hypothetical protein
MENHERWDLFDMFVDLDEEDIQSENASSESESEDEED